MCQFGWDVQMSCFALEDLRLLFVKVMYEPIDRLYSVSIKYHRDTVHMNPVHVYG